MARGLKHCHSIADLRAQAIKRLPRMMMDFLDGGAEDEITLRDNNRDFDRYRIVPNVLRDVSAVDLSTTVLGQKISLPLIFSPTGTNRLFHHHGEMAAAAAAAKAETIYTMSAMSNFSIEDVAAQIDSPKWFQIYVWKDREITKEFIQRCRASGYKALCLTVDVAALGKRERDFRNGMTLPPRLTLSSLFDAALHPRWWLNYLLSPRLALANVAGKSGKGFETTTTQAQFSQKQLDPSVTWDDLAWMIEEWNGPFAVKGIMSPQDAIRAADAGAQGVIVSNHGGRQLDQAVSPFAILPEIVDAVGDRSEVILDGGIRRGTDVIKALALGARACMTGRAYLYGLAAAGQPGVERALTLLRDELQRSMMLMGCRSPSELNSKYLRKVT